MINNSISFGTLYPTQDILELATGRKIRWDINGDSCDKNIQTLKSFTNNNVDLNKSNRNFIYNLFDYAAKNLQKQLPQLDPYIKKIEKICFDFQVTDKKYEYKYFDELDKIMSSAENELGQMIDVNTDEIAEYISKSGKSFNQ